MAKVSSPGPGIVKRLQLRARVLRDDLATHRQREKFLAARISIALPKEFKSWAGLETMQPEVKAADIMRYSTYATYRSETCSNQRDSTLQKAFSSASAADATGGREGERRHGMPRLVTNAEKFASVWRSPMRVKRRNKFFTGGPPWQAIGAEKCLCGCC